MEFSYSMGCVHFPCIWASVGMSALVSPWKDECWGLSDGEVCEQFWSGLCHLVAGLCITGYHHQLFILDMQMEHIQKSKQSGLGEWLHSHLLNAKRCLEDTERGLGKHDVDQLLVHFKAQHHYHTKPLPQQSKNPGQHEIDHILSLKISYSASCAHERKSSNNWTNITILALSTKVFMHM